jgi:hypothetical protein
MVKQAKNGKNMKKVVFFFVKAVFRTPPPEVVSGFFLGGGGGGGPLESGHDTWMGGWYLENHYSGPPPLVKVRMVRGGPEFLSSFDFKV